MACVGSVQTFLAWRNRDVETVSETAARRGYRPHRGGVRGRRQCRTARLLSAYGYAPAYGYAQPAPNYGYGYANQQRYTTVTVTNRGQNGYRDDVVQQQVACGSQYYDGYRTRTAPRC